MMEIIKTVVKGAVLTRENERGSKTAIFRLVWAGRNVTVTVPYTRRCSVEYYRTPAFLFFFSLVSYSF
jgi:hypothetical protein